MIKNQYLLPLIDRSLNRLSQAKEFIKLDFTNGYYKLRIKKGTK